MLFSSITFLFAFLPAILLVYYISPLKMRNLILMIFSLFFYAWGEPKYIFVMLASIIVGYGMGILTGYFMDKDKKKAAKVTVIFSVFVNLGILFFFKYIGFFTENLNLIPGIEIDAIQLELPLGISFYTFQILSYSIDVYRGVVKPQRNIITLGTYVTLFPQLIAGPIVRYETVADELSNRVENTEDFAEGIRRFIFGLGKKVMIANVAGEIFDSISKLPVSEYTVLLMWISSIAFTLQIYFDFSGYSDMAIGLGKMFGFNFLENFNYPYISKSITEFWRRWHISLSTWFRDYVYIPLGGNRCSRLKNVRNIFIVWFLTGFWHGAAWNFIIWGIYYFVLLIVEKNILGKLLQKIPAFFSHLYALFFINLGWVIFAYDNLSDLGAVLKNMFGFGGIPLCNQGTMFYIVNYGIFLPIAFVAATPLPKNIVKKLPIKKEITASFLETIYFFIILLISTAFLASEAFNPFLYFRF